MRTVLFVSYSMGIGGVEKALLGVLNKFVKEDWNIHLALIKPEGDFMAYLPDEVEVFHIKAFQAIKPIIHRPMRISAEKSFKAGKIGEGLRYTYFLLDSKLRKGASTLYKYAFRQIGNFSEWEYDLAVAFAGPDAFIDSYVAKKVVAKEKWGWIHFDISKFGTDTSIIKDAYRSFSVINVVSEDGRRIFNERFPEFAGKTRYTPNIVDKDVILELAEVEVDEDLNSTDTFNILTVGRISKEKGQLLALKALKILIERGHRNLKWWLVGAGTDMDRCRQYVDENALQEYVRFFGAKTNPYPYMKMCDLYVQPSQHEGFCITLAEARLFNMPIVATNFTGAKEQLENYLEPHAVCAYSEADLANNIELLIKTQWDR